MKKKLFFAALASIVLVGCTSNDFVGDTPPAVNGSGQAIAFGGNAGKVTRATSNTGTVPEMLDNHFFIYGVKTDGTNYADVFGNYSVWYSETQSTSNPDAAANAYNDSWEYVGDGSTYGGLANQTIKYWDYSFTNYHFVAGSPYSNFEYNVSGEIASATVTGLTGHINPNTSGTAMSKDPVYIADPVNVPKADYREEVTFNFRRQQARVRVGIFETIPGYSISEIHFYPMSNSGTTGTFAGISARTDQYIVLNSVPADYFAGTPSGSATATVTYDWATTPPTYSFDYTSGLTRSRTFYAGEMTGVPATTSTGAVADLYGAETDMETTTGYFTVMPTPTETDATPILIKCDYVLTAEDGQGETITVTGATAAIPAAYCKWAPNVSYTYLFKISADTNGTTGDPTNPNDPEGLYPITFDAYVEAVTDAVEGTITTVTTPSITTYQEGSVTATGIQYAASKEIYTTVQNDENGELNTVAASVLKVFKLDSEKTEADLQLVAPTNEVTVSFPSTAASLDNGKISIPAYKYAYFTPDANGYYAIQFKVKDATGTEPAVYTYKVVKVG